MIRSFQKLLLCLVFLFQACIATDALSSTTTIAKQAIVMDYNTGKILFEHNADEQMPTSSMSKVMTMYLVFEALKEGSLKLEDSFLVSEKAWKKGGSKMFVPVGKKVAIEDLIRGVIIQSGNDATIVLAEGIAGDEESFAIKMNLEAQKLGMSNSHFTNASGWPDPEHYSTARDLATLAHATLKNFPEFYHYYSEKEFEFSDIKQSNRNPLLKLNVGADGLKTGHTEDGGYGLIGSGIKDNRRVIVVINGLESEKDRREEATRLLQWGLGNFTETTLFTKGEELDRAPVYLGLAGSVGLKAKETVDILIPVLSKSDIKVDVSYSAPLKAPILKGQEVGIVTIQAPNSETVEVPLVTSEGVEEMGFLQKVITKARLITTGEGHFY